MREKQRGPAGAREAGAGPAADASPLAREPGAALCARPRRESLHAPPRADRGGETPGPPAEQKRRHPAEAQEARGARS